MQEDEIDEPALPGRSDSDRPELRPESRADRIRALVLSQPYAVLSTQGEGQPYASLLAVATTPDLSSIVFSTPRTTRKYGLLEGCDRVAFLFDSRSDQTEDLMAIEAVTVTGRSAEIASGTAAFGRWGKLLIDRHPHLAQFVEAPSCALFRVAVVRAFHVVRFQEVAEWTP
ncbi:MAG: pyridoxamine 5'-phosphate oxidase family protein [Planctomycetota bacterium]|jgi:nitroimidazol reductase NimA-like FMN-containing flavoprotein (pyridoxamine 5'-phosphate oxidase superfamily)